MFFSLQRMGRETGTGSLIGASESLPSALLPIESSSRGCSQPNIKGGGDGGIVATNRFYEIHLVKFNRALRKKG